MSLAAEASRLSVVPRLRDEGWLAEEATPSIDMALKSYRHLLGGLTRFMIQH